MSWDTEEKQLDQMTLEQMDRLVIALKSARLDYEEHKKVAANAAAKVEEIEKKLIAALKANNRTGYGVDGVGKVSFYIKESFTTPKTNEAKKELFDYIVDKYGGEALMTMTSINSQTLNSWANKESEAGVMQIPGLEAPTGKEILSFRKD